MVITGIGAMMPMSFSVDDFWDRVSQGRSAVGPLTRFDSEAQGLPVHAAAQIHDFDHRPFLPGLDPRHAAKYTREITIAMSAAAEAWRDAKLEIGRLDPLRVGILMSSSRGPLDWWRGALGARGHEAFADVRAMFHGLPGCPATLSAIHLGVRGTVSTLSNACVGGHQAIGFALNEIRSGTADVMLIGGHEFPITPEVARCYLALGDGVLSAERDEPHRAVRPYSHDRDGFALGEGSMVIVLERESHARERGARCYARLLGARTMNEAAHATTMDLTGEVTAALIRRLLADHGRVAEDVDYFCAHGTATRYNDIAESRALRALYPGRSTDRLPPISSNKPIYGHTFGLAGIINVAATGLMIHHRRIAPTANLTEIDPECDHDHVFEGPRDADIETAVSLSFAFGSQTAVVALEPAS
ncbi:beta-ketoacyl-[acyl-carrier-protein] synthase family protein [Actinocrinis puniceicyclus]|uniref:Beta-ketoacyl-[acyl-carrier-protein] synthase family protein n=1 Tax=Actinocrinis puniceicyclus TaxID=977794 RepID=A0A8J7WN48_9ACTN|nr:beta-ketoacyl-[acyl-carrier-protein] synthase family protein [Actinocrinis puniceicyclus]MBS2964383.1 beta-ketoacyl-[acyl-carrier-protein] synthase family protein [Actinocrinis puniceicyclus]